MPRTGLGSPRPHKKIVPNAPSHSKCWPWPQSGLQAAAALARPPSASCRGPASCSPHFTRQNSPRPGLPSRGRVPPEPSRRYGCGMRHTCLTRFMSDSSVLPTGVPPADLPSCKTGCWLLPHKVLKRGRGLNSEMQRSVSWRGQHGREEWRQSPHWASLEAAGILAACPHLIRQ